MSVKEIVTLQIGHYSNFVGAHWWNIQESSFVYNPAQINTAKEICHDVLYREGENRLREVTFTPRLIAFDLKGSLKSLKQEGVLYDTGAEGEDIKWFGDVTMHQEELEEPNMFLKSLEQAQNMDTGDLEKEIADDEKNEDVDHDTKKKKPDHHHHHHVVKGESGKSDKNKPWNTEDNVTVWSDFLGTHFHPKSVHIVQEYRHQDGLGPFDLFNSSKEVLSNYETTCEWEDRIHYFTEECDNLQGFHVLVDTHDGFGGLGAGVIEYLEEEFPGKGIFSFGLTPTDILDNTAQARSSRIINSALAYDKMCSSSSLFVPVSLASSLWKNLGKPIEISHVNYKSVPYHTSAIIASTLDTMSLPYRLDAGAMNLRDITHSFNSQNRKIATLNAGFPLGVSRDESLIDFFSNHGEKFPWQPITPHVSNENLPFIQSVVMRGVSDKMVATKTDPRKIMPHLIGSKSTNEVLRNYLEEKSCGNLFASNSLESPLKTSSPFPQIFRENVCYDGFLSPLPRPDEQRVDSVPMISSLQSTSEVAGVLDQLYEAASKMKIQKHHRYVAGGLEEDDYEEALVNIKAIASNYRTDVEAL